MSTPCIFGHQSSASAGRTLKHRTWNHLKWLSVVPMHIVCWNPSVGVRCACHRSKVPQKHRGENAGETWMSRWKLGSMVFFSPLLICREYILVMGVYLGEITHCSVLTIDPITSWNNRELGELVVFREMIHHFCAFGDFSGCWLVGDVAVLGGPGWLGMLLLFYFVVFSRMFCKSSNQTLDVARFGFGRETETGLERIEAN